MTELSSIPQIVTQDTSVATAPSKQPAPVSTPVPSPSRPSPSPSPQAAPVASAVSSTGTSSGIPYQLHYDADTRHFILEARDPKTGAVIVQVPRQSALQQIQATATATATSPLGRRVDEST